MKHITADQILKQTENLALLDNQKEYRKQLAAFIRMHTMRVRRLSEGAAPAALPTVSMFVVASTGSGKTYVTSRIAEAAGVNIITIDCSSLSREGWRGVSLAKSLHKAFLQTRSKDAFETSIVFLDEFDKLRLHFGEHDEGNTQPNLLRLFDGEVSGEVEHGETFTANTSRMSFVFCGAFSGLEDIIKRRTEKPVTIGFGGTVEKRSEDRSILSKTTTEDLVKYGIMRELVGRIGQITHIPKLSENDYRTLINGENGSIKERYNNLFSDIAVSVDISEEACTYLAKEADTDDLGARAIAPMVDKHMMNSVLDVESDTSITKVVLKYSENKGLHAMFEYGERVRRWEVQRSRKNVRKNEKHVEIPDANISFILKKPDGVKETVNLLLHVFDSLDRNGRSLFQAFLYCALTYLKHYCNEEDQNIGSLEKLVVHVGNEDHETFDVLVRDAINASASKDTSSFSSRTVTAKGELEKSYKKLRQVISHYPHTRELRSNVKAVREEWYRLLFGYIS